MVLRLQNLEKNSSYTILVLYDEPSCDLVGNLILEHSRHISMVLVSVQKAFFLLISATSTTFFCILRFLLFYFNIPKKKLFWQ